MKTEPTIEEQVNMILVRVIQNQVGVGNAGKEIVELIATERKEAVEEEYDSLCSQCGRPIYPPKVATTPND